MMTSIRHAPYTVSEGWRGVRLDYADGELAAFVLIPDDDIEQVTPTMLRQAVSRLCRPNETIGFVLTRLPRFTVATSKDLVDLFTAIGVEHGMDRAMTTDLPTIPTQAKQQAIIVVDEQGTVVSTVTIICMGIDIPPLGRRTHRHHGQPTLLLHRRRRGNRHTPVPQPHR